MASYLNKEISEWNTTDLCNWLLANKFRGISELCQKYSISGYDLFYINDEILKTELNLKSFHERKVTQKLFTKLTYEHLKLNVINSNGDNVILTLDNNPETQLGEISDYIGNMFNINPKDILFKDSTKQEVLSPTVKIVQMLILYPKIYKTLNVSNMKDYHQAEDELMESGNGDYQENNNQNNNNYKNKVSNMGLGSMESGMGLSGDMGFQDINMKKKYNNNYKTKSNNNNNNYYRGSKNRETNNNEMNDNRRDYYTYNNNYMSKNNKLNNNRNQNDNNEDTFLLKSGIDDNNITEQINNDMNKLNLNGSNNNIDFNKHNHKPNYMMNNNSNEDYQDNHINNNLGRQFKNDDRMFREKEQNERERQNMQFQSGSNEMGFNEESNLGLLSSANDDEMKFKPSYQINNNIDNNNNYGDYDNKKNYNIH